MDLYSNGISAGGCETLEFATPPSATNNLISCTLSDFVGLPRQITSDDGLIPYIPFANSIKVFKQQNLPILEIIAYSPGSPATIMVAGDYTDSILADTTISLETNTHVSLTSVAVDTVEIVYGDLSPPDLYTRITLKDKLENTLSTPISSFKYVAQGRLLVSGVDYAETLNPSGALLSEKIQFPVKLQPTDTIKIVYGTATLSSDLHYEIINSDVIRFAFPEITNGVESLGSPVTVGFARNLKIWGMVQDNNTQDPAKIIDVKANVVVTPVQLWDPARSSHYYLADRSIDIWRTTDPARYTNTDVTNQVVGAPIVGPPTDSGPVEVPPEGPAVVPTPPPPPPPPPPPDDVTPEPPVDPIETSLAASLASLEGLVVESIIPNTVNTYAYAAVTFSIDGNIETSITIGTPSISTPITVLGPWKTGGGTTANYELWAEKVSESISHPVANSTPSAISSLPSSGYGQWLPMGGSTDTAFYALADFDHPTEAVEAIVQVKFKIRSAISGRILAEMTNPVTIRAYSTAP